MSIGNRRSGALREHVRQSLEEYFEALNGHEPSGLYEFVVDTIEQPLLEKVLNYTDGNLTRASQVLGLNRGTLRKKLRKHGLA